MTERATPGDYAGMGRAVALITSVNPLDEGSFGSILDEMLNNDPSDAIVCLAFLASKMVDEYVRETPLNREQSLHALAVMMARHAEGLG